MDKITVLIVGLLIAVEGEPVPPPQQSFSYRVGNLCSPSSTPKCRQRGNGEVGCTEAQLYFHRGCSSTCRFGIQDRFGRSPVGTLFDSSQVSWRRIDSFASVGII